jgi:hypothetical protein
MRRSFWGLLGLATAGALSIGSAHAGLAGDSVNVNYLFPNSSTVFENDGTKTAPSTFSLLGGLLSRP